MSTATLQPSSGSFRKYCPLSHVPSEIWEEIAEILATDISARRKTHILPLARACRAFHGLAIPLLYRDISWYMCPSHQITRALSEVLENNPFLFTLVQSVDVFEDDNPDPDPSRVQNVPPLPRFTSLRRLRFQDVSFTPEMLLSVSTLPRLQKLSLSACRFSTKGMPPLLSTHQAVALKELSLEILERNPAWDLLPKIFPHVRLLALRTFAPETMQIMQSLIIHNSAAALTSLTVVLSSEEMSATLARVLIDTPELEVIDLGFSTVDDITVDNHAIPLLHTYRGPSRLAGTFIKGRNIRSVTFCQLWDRREDLAWDMGVIRQSSSTIISFLIHHDGPWTRKLSALLVKHARDVRYLEIACAQIEDVDSWPRTLFAELPSLEKICCPSLERGGKAKEDQCHQFVLDWGHASPTLRQISFAKSQWDRGGLGEWTRSLLF